MKIPVHECMLPEYCNFFKAVKVTRFTLWTIALIIHLSWSLRNRGSVLGAAVWCKWHLLKRQTPARPRAAETIASDVGLRHPERPLQLSGCCRVGFERESPRGKKSWALNREECRYEIWKVKWSSIFFFFLITEGVGHFCPFIFVFLAVRRQKKIWRKRPAICFQLDM